MTAVVEKYVDDRKDGKFMKNKEVAEVIHEALVMYIDDISVIESVKVIPVSEPECGSEKLLVTLKDGERYKLILRKCAS